MGKPHPKNWAWAGKRNNKMLTLKQNFVAVVKPMGTSLAASAWGKTQLRVPGEFTSFINSPVINISCLVERHLHHSMHISQTLHGLVPLHRTEILLQVKAPTSLLCVSGKYPSHQFSPGTFCLFPSQVRSHLQSPLLPFGDLPNSPQHFQPAEVNLWNILD